MRSSAWFRSPRGVEDDASYSRPAYSKLLELFCDAVSRPLAEDIERDLRERLLILQFVERFTRRLLPHGHYRNAYYVETRLQIVENGPVRPSGGQSAESCSFRYGISLRHRALGSVVPVSCA
ncbi:UNVERIFIED_CONTAM: hypothetical protein Sangu_0333900 [Sesamum angustifolium]|uniref:Uncharacterized protein n=1 Tax=Sesamum angustifolium TaxID=2727405 RepID=A0AAW2QR64_9LAMI